MVDDDKPKRKKPQVLRLDEIEDEGDHAVHQRARELFDRSMKVGAQIDWPALRTGGPAVHRAFLALLSIEAAAAPSSDSKMRKAAGKADPAKAGTPKTIPAKPALPRVERNWRDSRTSALDFRWQAFWAGAGVTTAVCLIAFLAIRWVSNSDGETS